MIMPDRRGPVLDAQRLPRAAGRNALRAQRLRAQARHVPRARRHGRPLPAYTEDGRAGRVLRRRGRPAHRVRAAHAARSCGDAGAVHLFPRTTTSRPPTSCAVAIAHDQGGAEERLAELEKAGQAPRGAAPEHAHERTTSRCCRRWASATGSRTTRGTSAAASRASGPTRCIDFFPKDFLLMIDESHAAVPQIGGDVRGRPLAQEDAGRLRLPPALGARQPPAQVSTSSTRSSARGSSSRPRPSTYEVEQSGGVIAEQVIRPTGLLDPEIAVSRSTGQVDDLIERGRGSASAWASACS